MKRCTAESSVYLTVAARLRYNFDDNFDNSELRAESPNYIDLQRSKCEACRRSCVEYIIDFL